MESAPRAALEVIQAEFLFELLIVLFDGPAPGCEPNEFLKRSIGGQVRQVVFKSFVAELFDQQPAGGSGLTPATRTPGGLHPHRCGATGRCLRRDDQTARQKGEGRSHLPAKQAAVALRHQ